MCRRQELQPPADPGGPVVLPTHGQATLGHTLPRPETSREPRARALTRARGGRPSVSQPPLSPARPWRRRGQGQLRPAGGRPSCFCTQGELHVGPGAGTGVRRPPSCSGDGLRVGGAGRAQGQHVCCWQRGLALGWHLAGSEGCCRTWGFL